MKGKLFGGNATESGKEAIDLVKLVEMQAKAMVNTYHETCFDVKQLQTILGVGKTNIYKLLKSGQLPSQRIGRRIVVPVSALAQFLVVNKKSLDK